MSACLSSRSTNKDSPAGIFSLSCSCSLPEHKLIHRDKNGNTVIPTAGGQVGVLSKRQIMTSIKAKRHIEIEAKLSLPMALNENNQNIQNH